MERLRLEPVFSVSFSPTNPFLAASGGGDDKSYLWSLETGQKIADLGIHADSCGSVAFSSDGKFVASGGMDGKLFIFFIGDALEISLISTLEGPSEISWIQWHPRGNVIVAAGEDGTIWMWQVPSGKCMNVLTGHADAVTCGQWTPDGKHIVSGSADGSIMLWDPKTGAAIKKWSQNDGRFDQAPVTSLAVNKDCTVIASGDQTGQTLILQLSTSKVFYFDSKLDSWSIAKP
jgi:WD40 repeat protein